MSLTATQFSAIIRGCPKLKKVIINSDVWCDSTICDTLLKQLPKYCPQLNYLSLCPGNFQITDSTLEALAKLPLKYLSLTSFPAITEIGFINLIKTCHTLNNCFIEDCFQITSTFITSLNIIFKGMQSIPLNITLQ
jgi:hypothetical protein